MTYHGCPQVPLHPILGPSGRRSRLPLDPPPAKPEVLHGLHGTLLCLWVAFRPQVEASDPTQDSLDFADCLTNPVRALERRERPSDADTWLCNQNQAAGDDFRPLGLPELRVKAYHGMVLILCIQAMVHNGCRVSPSLSGRDQH